MKCYVSQHHHIFVAAQGAQNDKETKTDKKNRSGEIVNSRTFRERGRQQLFIWFNHHFLPREVGGERLFLSCKFRTPGLEEYLQGIRN